MCFWNRVGAFCLCAAAWQLAGCTQQPLPIATEQQPRATEPQPPAAKVTAAKPPATALVDAGDTGSEPAEGAAESNSAAESKNAAVPKRKQPALPSTPVLAPFTAPGLMSDKLSPELQKQIASRIRNQNFGAVKKQKYLTPIDMDPEATFAELKARFARARREQDIHPCGFSDLHILYVGLRSGHFRKATGEKEWLRWAEEQPADPTPLAALGNMAINRAWEVRGTGRAYTVNDGQFVEFRKRLQVARDYLLRAQKLEPNDPNIYALLVNTSLGLDTERSQVEAWVAAGSKAFPRYRHLYESTANYLLPKWHGDGDDLPRLAESFLKSLGGDDGYEAFSFTLMKAAACNPELLYLSGLEPADLLRGAKVLYRRYPEDHLIYDYCGFVAMRNLDREFCIELLPHLLKLEQEDALSGGIWKRLELFDQFVNFCAAPPVVDQPERWFYLNTLGAQGIAFVEGRDGPRIVSTTTKEPVVLSVWDLNDLTQPVGYWPVVNGKCLYNLHSNGPSRRLAAICGIENNAHVIVYDTSEAQQPVVIKCAETPSECFFSKDGSRLAIVFEQSADIVDPATGKTLQRIAPFQQQRWGAVQNAFSDDGSQLAVLSKDGVILWDALTGQKLQQFDGKAHEQHGGSSVNWPLGIDAQHRLVAGSATEVKDPRRKEMPLFSLTRHLPPSFPAEKLGEIVGFQRVMAKHANELIAAITVFPGTKPEKWVIELYDLQTGKCLRTIDGHPNYLTTTTFSPDGRWYATTDMMGVTRLWELDVR